MERLKLPRSSYPELVKIIKAYAKRQNPSSLAEVSHLTGISRTGISDNNAFLSAIGVIEGGKGKSATPKGSELARALEHEISEDIQRAWAAIITDDDFLSKMLQAITIRQGMESSQLETHIAYSAGESKTPSVMTGARAVVEILLASGRVQEVDGRVVPVVVGPGSSQGGAQSRDQVPATVQPSLFDSASIASSPQFITNIRVPTAALHIELHINATPEELDGLGAKLKKLLAEIEGTEEAKQSPDETQTGRP